MGEYLRRRYATSNYFIVIISLVGRKAIINEIHDNVCFFVSSERSIKAMIMYLIFQIICMVRKQRMFGPIDDVRTLVEGGEGLTKKRLETYVT